MEFGTPQPKKFKFSDHPNKQKHNVKTKKSRLLCIPWQYIKTTITAQQRQ